MQLRDLSAPCGVRSMEIPRAREQKVLWSGSSGRKKLSRKAKKARNSAPIAAALSLAGARTGSQKPGRKGKRRKVLFLVAIGAFIGARARRKKTAANRGGSDNDTSSADTEPESSNSGKPQR